MRTYGRKALGLVLMAALGLMAFSATAQAAEELELRSRHTAILLNGTALKTGETKTLTGKQTSAVGVLSIPAKGAEVICEEGKITNATAKNETDTQTGPEKIAIKKMTEKSESGSSGMAEGTVEFGKCKVNTYKVNEPKVELKESIPCTKAFNEHNKNISGVAGHPEAKGLILTFLHFHKIKVGGVVTKEQHLLIVRATQLKTGVNEKGEEVLAPFATLEFGGTCSLPEKVNITGGVSGEIPLPWTADVKEVPITIESETAKGKELNGFSETKLLFGASEAFLEGKATAELAGVEKWGVM